MEEAKNEEMQEYVFTSKEEFIEFINNLDDGIIMNITVEMEEDDDRESV